MKESKHPLLGINQSSEKYYAEAWKKFALNAGAYLFIATLVVLTIFIPSKLWLLAWLPVLAYAGDRCLFQYLRTKGKGSGRYGFFICDRDRRLKPAKHLDPNPPAEGMVSCSRCGEEVNAISQSIQRATRAIDQIVSDVRRDPSILPPRKQTFKPKTTLECIAVTPQSLVPPRR